MEVFPPKTFVLTTPQKHSSELTEVEVQVSWSESSNLALQTSFAKLVSSATKLRRAHFSGFRELCSIKVVLALASSPILEYLKVPFVSREWSIELGHAIHDPFRNVRELHTTTTDDDASFFLEHFKNLTDLTVEMQEPSTNILQALRHTPQLQRLCVCYVDTENYIDGNDLLQAAKLCPRLTSVDLDKDSDFASPSNISDITIEQVAQALPNLEVLRLCVPTLSHLTEDAMVYLGTHCKRLRELQLSANINWLTLARYHETSSTLFPALYQLVIFPPAPPFLDFSSCAEVTALAGQLLKMMPACDVFSPEEWNENMDAEDENYNPIGTEDVALHQEFERLRKFQRKT